MGETLVNETNNLEIWIPAVVSIVTLIINLLFYVFVQPRITYKTTARQALAKTSIEFLNYLSSKVRINYSDYTSLSKLQNLYEFIVDRDFSN